MIILTLRQKILSLTIAPILLTTVLMMVFVQIKFTEMGEREVADLRTSMYEEKRVTLKNYIDIALTSIQPLLTSGKSDKAVRDAVAAQLRAMEYETDLSGYMFVHRYDGINIALRPKPALEGTNLLGLQDANGLYLVQELIKQGRKGSGYVEYGWNKSKEQPSVTKLSYVADIPQLGWIVGTGFYIDDIDIAVNNARQKVHEEVNNAIVIIALSGLALITLAIFLSLLITNRMTRPLRETATALTDISQGHGDLAQRLTIHGKDEVGEVAIGFNGFADKIQTLVVDLKGGITELCVSIKNMDQVCYTAHNNVDEQRQKTTQAASAVHQMALAVQEVASNAASAASAAQHADDESHHGKQLLDQTISEISSLSEKINHATQAVEELHTNTDKIGNVVDVITDIADQTNLLALNAAIEAARAGEYGRGFAVVADEVRTLATRTQQSTDEIRSMIENLQAGAANASDVMQVSQQQSAETVQTAVQTGESLEKITRSISTITEMNTQIASAAEEQTSAAEEINQNIQLVATISDSSMESTEKLAQTSQELVHLEQQLSRMVEQFKT